VMVYYLCCNLFSNVMFVCGINPFSLFLKCLTGYFSTGLLDLVLS
jgi:hypothetical protein